jgi:hypothetical protein
MFRGRFGLFNKASKDLMARCIYFLAILYNFGANVHSGCVLQLTKFFALSDESPVVYSIFTKLHVP